MWIQDVLLYLLCFMQMPPFLGQSMSHHPIYSTFFLFFYFNYFNYGNYTSYTYYWYAVSLLNLHEDERTKPRNWILVGWIPVYDESRDKRPNKGFDSTSARKIRLYHQCWIEFLDKWAERTKEAILLPWADGVNRLARIFIGGIMGDQQEVCVSSLFCASQTLPSNS